MARTMPKPRRKRKTKTDGAYKRSVSRAPSPKRIKKNVKRSVSTSKTPARGAAKKAARSRSRSKSLAPPRKVSLKNVRRPSKSPLFPQSKSSQSLSRSVSPALSLPGVKKRASYIRFRKPEVGGIIEVPPPAGTLNAPANAGIEYRFFGYRSTNAKLRKLITFSINFFVNITHKFDADIAKEIKIDIVFIKSLAKKTQCEGSCHYFVGPTEFPRHFEIVLDPCMKLQKMMTTLSHEIEHVRQFSEGLLVIPEEYLADDGGYTNGIFDWRPDCDSPSKKVNTNRTGCFNLPWEKAACRRETKPMDRLQNNAWYAKHVVDPEVHPPSSSTSPARSKSKGKSKITKKGKTPSDFGKAGSLERRIVQFHALAPSMLVGKDTPS